MRPDMKRSLIFAALLGVVTAASAQDSGVDKLLISGAPAASQPTAPPGSVRNPLQQVAPGVAASTGPMEGAPDSSAQREQRDHDAAFERALREAVPMSPQEIRKYRTNVDGARKATVEPLAAGRPVTRMVSLSLKPGELTPSLRVQPGIVSTLTFSDITGKPWPVLSVVTGNPGAFVAQSAGPEGKSNVIVVSATQEHIVSNLAVTLVGHPVPVTILLDQDKSETDLRVDMRIESRGPNAAQDIVGSSSLAPTSDVSMISFLDGTPPDGAKLLKSSSRDVEAWKFEDLLYVRTHGEVVSPSYSARSSNVSGVSVFQMAYSPVIIVSTDGRYSHVHIDR